MDWYKLYPTLENPTFAIYLIPYISRKRKKNLRNVRGNTSCYSFKEMCPEIRCIGVNWTVLNRFADCRRLKNRGKKRTKENILIKAPSFLSFCVNRKCVDFLCKLWGKRHHQRQSDLLTEGAHDLRETP